MRKTKKIPKFKSENEERKFWANHSFIDYFDLKYAIINPEFPNLRPSTQSISLRLPKWLLSSLKREANKRDVPYQSLIKIFLAYRVAEEQRKYRSK